MKLALFTTLFFLLGCSPSKHNKAGVVSAMKYYDHLILTLNADSIAALYTPDGNLGGIAIGRDSIRNFLSSFKNITVLSQLSIPVFTVVKKDSALQKGTYTQSDILSGKDTVHVKGEFTAHWKWIKGEGWRIKKMETRPSN